VVKKKNNQKNENQIWHDKKIKGEWNCKKLINFKKLSQIKQITIKMGIKCDIWKNLEDEMEKKNAIL
jgi:hypothetical protein